MRCMGVCVRGCVQYVGVCIVHWPETVQIYMYCTVQHLEMRIALLILSDITVVIGVACAVDVPYWSRVHKRGLGCTEGE